MQQEDREACSPERQLMVYLEEKGQEAVIRPCCNYAMYLGLALPDTTHLSPG